MPPSAASTGTPMVRRSRSSPTASSRVTSSPTTRKNSAIRPSSTQCLRSMDSSGAPALIPISVAHSRSYESAQGELAQARADRGGTDQQETGADLGGEEPAQRDRDGRAGASGWADLGWRWRT